MGVYAITNTLLEGDPVTWPAGTDVIVQKGALRVGEPVPDDWIVLTGNERFSTVYRVAYRYQIDQERDAERARKEREDDARET